MPPGADRSTRPLVSSEEDSDSDSVVEEDGRPYSGLRRRNAASTSARLIGRSSRELLGTEEPTTELPVLLRRSARAEAAAASDRPCSKESSRGDCQPRAQAAQRSQGAARSSGESMVALPVVCCGQLTEDGCPLEFIVRLPASATLLSLKKSIWEILQVPLEMQRLQLTPEPGKEEIQHEVSVAELRELGHIYLVPAPELLAALASDSDEEDEEMEAYRAAVESLRGVIYKLRIIRPQGSGGVAAGKWRVLDFDPMTLVGDVQAVAEAELLGEAAGCERAQLLFNGKILRPDVPIHFAGITDGDVLLLAGHEAVESDDEDPDFSFEAGLRAWAAGA